MSGLGQEPTCSFHCGAPLASPACTGIDDAEYRPIARHPLQDVHAALGEGHAGSRHEILDRARHKHVTGAAEGGDAGTDVQGDATQRLTIDVTFARVNAGPDLNTEWLNSVSDGQRASNGSGGPVERCDEGIASGVDLLAAK